MMPIPSIQLSKMGVTWLVIIATAFVCIHAEPCPPGEEIWGDSCYRLLPESLSWEAACQACSDSGAGLTVPKSLEEHQFVWDMLKRNGPGMEGLWIGCSDKEEEDKWMQCNGQDPKCTYFNWAQGEPHPSLKLTEDCLEMRYERNGLWNDVPCNLNRRVICEHPAAPIMSCEQEYHEAGFFTAHCQIQDGITNPATRSTAWGLACRDDPQCRSFNLRQAKPGAMAGQRNLCNNGVGITQGKSRKCYYF